MVSEVPGLIYLSDYIDQHQRDWLLQKIDNQPWSNEIKRRVQHYGYKYDYRKRSIDASMALGDLPDWLSRLATKVQADGFMPVAADQIIVNEYLPGQGISAHIDCEPCFGAVVVSISLGSNCIMDLRHSRDKQHIPVLLGPGSLLVLSSESRYDWTHGIAARSEDVFHGRSYLRRRRVSVTLRTIVGGS